MVQTERVRNNITQITSTLVTGIWLLALFTGQSWWLPFMLFGYVALVPIVAMLFGNEEDVKEHWGDNVAVGEEQKEEEEDPITKLKQQYVEGEVSEEEFERKLDKLIETENITREDKRLIRDSIERELEHEEN